MFQHVDHLAITTISRGLSLIRTFKRFEDPLSYLDEGILFLVEEISVSLFVSAIGIQRDADTSRIIKL